MNRFFMGTAVMTNCTSLFLKASEEEGLVYSQTVNGTLLCDHIFPLVFLEKFIVLKTGSESYDSNNQITFSQDQLQYICRKLWSNGRQKKKDNNNNLFLLPHAEIHGHHIAHGGVIQRR